MLFILWVKKLNFIGRKISARWQKKDFHHLSPCGIINLNNSPCVKTAKEDIWKATPRVTRKMKVSQEVRQDGLHYSPLSLGRVQKGNGKWHNSCCYITNTGIVEEHQQQSHSWTFSSSKPRILRLAGWSCGYFAKATLLRI